MLRVIITGAGVAGPTAAYWLSRAGHSVTVVERATSLDPIGQNIDVDGGALRVVEKMGLFQRLRQLGTGEVGTRFVRPNGKGALASFPLIKGRMTGPTSENEILRGDLASLLTSATMNDPNVKYILGTTIEKIDEHSGEDVTKSKDDKGESPPVTVKLSNGQEGTYDLCIIADGQWSRLRKQHFPPPTIIDKDMYVAYFTVPRKPTDQNWWELYLGLKSRVVSTRPDAYGTTRGSFWKMPLDDEERKLWQEASRSRDRQVQNALLEKTFADAGWEAKRLLKDMVHAKDFYFHDLKQIKLSKWSDEKTGRIVCVGDAAYAPTPLTGSGAVLAILGAYILAGEVSTSYASGSVHPRAGLEAYEKAFKPFVEEIQNIPSFLPGFVVPRYWWHRSFLHSIVWFGAKMMSIPAFQSKAVRHGEDEFKLPLYDVFGEDPIVQEG